jgi:hypothetical protein
MLYMNDYEIERALRHYANHPVLGKATKFLADFKDEVDMHSDGWPYWAAPVRAAAKLMTLIQHPTQATEQAFRQALVPIRGFYTRRGNAAGMRFPTIRSKT